MVVVSTSRPEGLSLTPIKKIVCFECRVLLFSLERKKGCFTIFTRVAGVDIDLPDEGDIPLAECPTCRKFIELPLYSGLQYI